MMWQQERSIPLHHRFIRCYKKSTLAIFFSFALSVMLITALLVLIFTNHRTENIQYQMLYTASDCRVNQISFGQIEQLKASDKIAWYGVAKVDYNCYSKGFQDLYLEYGDDAYITMTSKLVKGRMPREKDEVVGEKWALLNLGIEPVCNQKITIKNKFNDKMETKTLVGILADSSSNKEHKVLYLYESLIEDKSDKYNVYVRFKNDQNYKKSVSYLRDRLQLKRRQITKCPGREDQKEVQEIGMKMASILIFLCVVVFYGVYRITLHSRRKEYGVLRGVGMKRGQLKVMILKELYQIYIVSVPFGLLGGFLVASMVMGLSGDGGQVIYLNNQEVEFSLVIPYYFIGVCIGIITLIVGFIGYFSGRKISRKPTTELIAVTEKVKRKYSHCFSIGEGTNRNHTIFFLGCKYIFKDIMTSFFVVLTISLGVTLFTGLSYQAHVIRIFREDTKEMNYLNGQYEMGISYFESAYDGISREIVEKVAQLKEVDRVKTETGIPIRVVDDKKVKRNHKYYDQLNREIISCGLDPLEGEDGVDNVYKSVLYGYNKTALHHLKKYVIEGYFHESGLKDDEIILSILRMGSTKQTDLPGAYREGTPLVDYHVGDKIRIKYRADFNTGNSEYETFQDVKAQYIYKTYKVVAIVSFEYIYNSKRTVYPLLITNEDRVRKICPDAGTQWMYIDGKKNHSENEQEQLERKLIRLGVKNKYVSTRSMISEIDKNNMLFQKQMVYIVSIVVVAFLLVLINVMNNLAYRMQIRTREIGMFRAIGMSIKMVRQMVLIENTMLALFGIGIAYFLSQPVLWYLYQHSEMKGFSHSFQFNYGAFSLISLGVVGISFMITMVLMKPWKTKKLMDKIDF